MVLRTKIKSEICFLSRVFPVAEFIPRCWQFLCPGPGPGLTALRDCNNEPGPGIERELVTGNSSASEGFPATQQSADPGRNRWLGLTLGWLWADIWPLSPLQVHVMCHVTSSAALLTLQVSATVSCFFLAPGLVTLAWCQICPPPGELLELLTVSRLTRLATKVRSASGLGLSGNDRREWGREQWSQETMDHIRGWAGAMMAWLHSQCWLTVDKGFSFKTITSTVHSRCPDRNPLVDRSSLGMMRGCPPSWWWPGAGPGQPCVPAAPCLGPGPCLLSVSVPLPASCSHHPRCFCWRYTTHILM